MISITYNRTVAEEESTHCISPGRALDFRAGIALEALGKRVLDRFGPEGLVVSVTQRGLRTFNVPPSGLPSRSTGLRTTIQSRFGATELLGDQSGAAQGTGRRAWAGRGCFVLSGRAPSFLAVEQAFYLLHAPMVLAGTCWDKLSTH